MGEAAPLLARIAARAETEPDAVLPVLRVLAGEPHVVDDAWRATVLQINRARVQADREAFVARSWSTEQVAEHLGVRSRQAVAQRRQRGTLLGAPVGMHTYYPAWQFGPEGLAPGLDALLTLLREAGVDDARAADDLLRMPHGGLDGRTLLDVWQAGDTATLEAWVGDVGTWRR